jgi:hypothetical protein
MTLEEVQGLELILANDLPIECVVMRDVYGEVVRFKEHYWFEEISVFDEAPYFVARSGPVSPWPRRES